VHLGESHRRPNFAAMKLVLKLSTLAGLIGSGSDAGFYLRQCFEAMLHGRFARYRPDDYR
jgi:hypothetical protein